MYIQITAKVEEANDASYERETEQADGTTKIEQVQQFELRLTIPSMTERVRVVFAADVAPKPDILAKWELEETWVVVSADAIRSSVFTGSKKPIALVSFNGVEVHEASQAERKELQAARQSLKTQQKQDRVRRKAEKKAAAEAAKKTQAKAEPAA